MSKLDRIAEYVFSKKVVKLDEGNYINVSNLFCLYYSSEKHSLIFRRDEKTYTYVNIDKFLENNPECDYKGDK